MTHRTLRTVRPQDTPEEVPPRAPKAADRGYARRAAAVQQLVKEILVRIEVYFRDDPLAIVDRQEGAQPREIEDAQSYFLEKIGHARETMREMAELLRLSGGSAEKRELIRGELMALFVLVESLRPSQDSERGPDAGEETMRSIYMAIDALGLDVINLRQRLK